jgi:hypothetical protein
MLGINRVAGNLQKIYTAVMEKGSVPILGRKGDYRRECCPDARAKLVLSDKDESELIAHLEEILEKFAIQKYDCQLQTKP